MNRSNKRYTDYINSVRGKKFDENDFFCLIFVFDGIREYTGIDLFKKYRHYKTVSGMQRRLKKDGYNSFIEAMDDALNRVHPSAGTIGDIAVFKVDDKWNYALGLVNGEKVFVLKNEHIGLMDLLDAEWVYKLDG